MYFRVAIIFAAMTLSACSSWVYRYDVPQGNYLEKKGIEKLQVGMTKEQVKFILGSPVVVDAFNNDTWSYVYRLNSGRGSKFDRQKQLIIEFSDDVLISATGDYSLSENFNTPFNKVASTISDDAVINTKVENSVNNETLGAIEESTPDISEETEEAIEAAEKAAEEVAVDATEAI